MLLFRKLNQNLLLGVYWHGFLENIYTECQLNWGVGRRIKSPGFVGSSNYSHFLVIHWNGRWVSQVKSIGFGLVLPLNFVPGLLMIKWSFFISPTFPCLLYVREVTLERWPHGENGGKWPIRSKPWPWPSVSLAHWAIGKHLHWWGSLGGVCVWLQHKHWTEQGDAPQI
jgi:hypothetical protein